VDIVHVDVLTKLIISILNVHDGLIALNNVTMKPGILCPNKTANERRKNKQMNKHFVLYCFCLVFRYLQSRFVLNVSPSIGYGTKTKIKTNELKWNVLFVVCLIVWCGCMFEFVFTFGLSTANVAAIGRLTNELRMEHFNMMDDNVFRYVFVCTFVNDEIVNGQAEPEL
jgi:hypothetical protein